MDSATSNPKDPAILQDSTKAEHFTEAETSTNPQVESENEDEEDDEEETEPPIDGSAAPSSSAPKKKKKKSKRKRVKEVFSKSEPTPEDAQKKISSAVNGLSDDQISQMLEMNPALARELGLGDLPMKEVAAKVKKLDLNAIMTGLAENGKNVKDMASYKFWGTQPVPKFGENKDIVEGPFKTIDVSKVPKEPAALGLEGFEWVTMDITSDAEIQEIFKLLYGHYVEDNEASFRFNYSPAFLKWALQPPGWKKEWNVGIRATKSKALVAFISAVPVEMRVRSKVLHASEVNFLCVNKKLRARRLAPVLIKEVTRRCYVEGTFQAVYTAGVVLPTPVSTCRYFHRSLDWQKLNDVGFSPLPYGSTPARQVLRFKLPDKTATKGLRALEAKDLEAITILLRKYLKRFELAPEFTEEEIAHWLLHKGPGEQVVWCYVVEDPTSKEITDFFSFYNIESSVVKPEAANNHKSIRAAYMFYYATDAAFSSDSDKLKLKNRLNALMNDALILAKRAKFDVFNALTLSDNNMFLEEQKFGAGDGQLHYYLYNYLANPIAGGVNKSNAIDSHGSGVGLVML